MQLQGEAAVLSHLVHNIQILRQVQCLLQENAKLETSSRVCWRPPTRCEMDRLQEEEQMELPLPRNWRRHAFRSDWAWKEGIWVQVADMLQEWDRTNSHLPIQTGIMEVETPCWKQAGAGGVWGVKEVGEAWAAPRRQVEQHLDCTLTPCSAWYCCCASGHFQKQTCRHYNSPPKLRPYTAISTCKRGEQHAEQMKVLSHHGTHSSPCFTSFGPLILPWGCSVQPMLYARLFAAQRSSYCTDCDTVNQSFSLGLPGKNWACIALLNKKGLSTNNWKFNIVVLVSWVIK